jgi:AraC-like DNA-binding protein
VNTEDVTRFYDVHRVSRPTELVNTFTDSFYFAKDMHGRFVYANKLLYDYFDLSSPSDAIGKTDADFFRGDITEHIRRDDISVMNGAAITNKLELIEDGSGDVLWLITSKIALKNNDGLIVGVEGISRSARHTQANMKPYNVFGECIHYMQKHFKNAIYIDYLAGLACMSVSTFERKFKKQFGYSPKQHIKRLRIQESCRLLRAGKSIQQAASESGFCDQSYFTREFRAIMGKTPKIYQRDIKPLTKHAGAIEFTG